MNASGTSAGHLTQLSADAILRKLELKTVSLRTA